MSGLLLDTIVLLYGAPTNTVFFNNSGVGGEITTYSSTVTPPPSEYVGGVIDNNTYGLVGVSQSFEIDIYNKDFVNLLQQVFVNLSSNFYNFGLITSDKSITFEIYNRTTETMYLSSTDIPSNFGCILTNAFIGMPIYPGSFSYFTLTAKLMQGDEEVFGTFPILFSNGPVNISVQISRQPTVVYSLAPDRGSYKEQYVYKTSIFTSLSKQEKRRIIVRKPKHTFQYGVTTSTPSEATYLQNTIYTGLYDIMYQPVWSKAVRTTSTTSGDTIVLPTYRNIFDVGAFVSIILNENQAVLLKVLQVNPNSLVLSKEIEVPEGSIVAPVCLCTPDKSTSSNYTIANDNQITMSFTELNL